ncbi:hypothetical protein D3C75_1319920 [compost metagenome]
MVDGPQARWVSTAEQFTQGETALVVGQEIDEVGLLPIVNAKPLKVQVSQVGEDRRHKLSFVRAAPLDLPGFTLRHEALEFEPGGFL